MPSNNAQLSREELIAKVEELEDWRELFLILAARALTPERMAMTFDPDEPDLAIIIDRLIEDRDALLSKLEEIEEVIGTDDSTYKIEAILSRPIDATLNEHDARVLEAAAEAYPGGTALDSRSSVKLWLVRLAKSIRGGDDRA